MKKNSNGYTQLHIDATGGVFPKFFGKQVFLYSVVSLSNISYEPCIPALEFLSSSHTGHCIGDVLFSWKNIFTTIAGKVHVLVSDFSFAILNGASMAMNVFTLIQQINKQWRCLTDDEDYDFTVLRLCVSHYVNNVCRIVSKLKLEKQVSHY